MNANVFQEDLLLLSSFRIRVYSRPFAVKTTFSRCPNIIPETYPMPANSTDPSQPSLADPVSQQDVIVYGATPGGIAAALASARAGARTLLVATGRHVGGMAASGLSTTDAVRCELFKGGIMHEFVAVIREYYRETYGGDSEAYRLSRDGWWYEPRVAELAFEKMLAAEPNLTVLRERQIGTGALQIDGRRITRITLAGSGNSRQQPALEVSARTFVDGTYEGDLAAAANVPYRVGREGREEFGESLAGVVYQDWKRGVLLPRSTGEAHPGIQAYCARLTLTDNPENQAIITQPDEYESLLPRYLPLLEDFAAGRSLRIRSLLSMASIPNRKVDSNGMIEAMTSYNLPGENHKYPTASPARRLELDQLHRHHALGLLWFLQHDSRVPEQMQKEVRQWHLCADEYPDDNHLPWQIYVRQGRRIEGRFMLSQHDFIVNQKTGRTPFHEDAIAVAEHSFDVHPCQSRQAAIEGWMEGVLWFPDKAHGLAQPGQVPWRAMLPKNIDNLLVPVALSATHVAFSVVRMEPLWMATGQAAGIAAAMAHHRNQDAAAIHVPDLQSLLYEMGQTLDYWSSVRPPPPPPALPCL
jgi:hypothetical protein